MPEEDYYTEEDIIHYNTESIVCPYCGYYYFDCSDFTDEHGTENCVNCGSRFKYNKNMFITWDTEMLDV